MRDDVTLERRLSLAEPILRMFTVPVWVGVGIMPLLLCQCGRIDISLTSKLADIHWAIMGPESSAKQKISSDQKFGTV